MTALSDHLNRLDTEKILLVEIDPDGSPVYIADTPYFTEPSDATANKPYFPVIAESGVPRLSRRIQEVWSGRSVPAWGPLKLVADKVDGVDLSQALIRGRRIRALLTGPRSEIPWLQAAVVLDGIVGRRSGNPDEGITIELLDRQAQFDEIQVPANTYDGTESASVPPATVGKSKPLCLGICRNVAPVLIDSSSFVYQVNDGPIYDVPVVKDNGIVLAKVTGAPMPGEYSVQSAAGTFTLGITPSGQVTCDVQGMMDGATWLSSTAQIIDWLSRTYGSVVSADIDITGLPNDAIGIYINSIQRLSDVITSLIQSLLGWWGFTRQSKLRVRLFQAPAAGGETFDETVQLSDIQWKEEVSLIWSVPTLYRRNWTQITQPASAVGLDDVAWLNSRGYESRVEDSTIRTAYPYATTARKLETFFDTQAPAATVANRALSLFGQPRKRTSVTVPFTDPPLELGASITLTDTDVVDGSHVITGMVDRWDGEIPLIELEVWG